MTRRAHHPLPLTLLGVTLVAIASPSAAFAEATRAMTVEDVARVQQVIAADLSPDGRLAAFVRNEPRDPDEKNGPAWRRLYVQALDGGAARPFVAGDERVADPRFSPDGRLLGFVAKRHGQDHAQVWAIPTDGGEARPLTAHGASVSAFVWLADGRIAFVAPAPPTKRERAVREKGYAPRFFEEDLDERAAWVAPVDFAAGPADAVRLTEGLSVWQIEADPKRPRLFVGASKRPLVDEMYMFQDIHVVEVPADPEAAAPVAPRLLVDVPGKLGPFQAAPDGAHVAYSAAMSRADHAPSHVYVVPAAGGAPVDLTPPAFEGHAGAVTWWDEDTVLYHADEGVWTTWSLLDLDDEPAERRVLYDAEKTGVVAGLPLVRREGRAIAFVGHAATHPRELFAASRKGAPKRLTDSNPWLAELSFGAQEVVRYEAADGLVIEGVLIHPVEGAGTAAGAGDARPPLIVDVHGGPEANIDAGWLTSYFHPGQVAAGRGYAVFYPNYRGSTGRGTEFAASSFADPAGKEFDDVADGIRHLTRAEGGVADPERVGLLGGSYGGYAANWFATWHTALVKAVVSFVGVSDLVSKRLLTDIPYEDQYVHMGRPVREMWDLMLERSPIRWAEKSETAVLLLHGDADPRVHPSQAQEMFRALKMVDHPATRLVFYPGEGHGNRLRSYRLDASIRTLDWLDWYVRDGQPLDGPLPALDLSDRYGLDLPEAGDGAEGAEE